MLCYSSRSPLNSDIDPNDEKGAVRVDVATCDEAIAGERERERGREMRL